MSDRYLKLKLTTANCGSGSLQWLVIPAERMKKMNPTERHLVEMEKSILSQNPEILKLRVDWPSEKDMQLAFALEKFGTPPYSEKEVKFLHQLAREAGITSSYVDASPCTRSSDYMDEPREEK